MENMSINLEALEQAFAAVEKIGKGEITFDVGETPVTLRILYPDEETAVQEWASAELATDSEDEDAAAGVFQFLDRFKLATLSYAIVQVGDLDLRDTPFVPTGEKLDNEKEVKIPRNEALRKLITRWTSSVRDGMFRKYGELLEDVGAKAEEAIKFKPADIQGEIDRLNGRIEELQAQLEAEGKSASFADQVRHINEMGVEEEAHEETPPAEAAEEPEKPAPSPPPQKRQPVTPQAAPPPAQTPVIQPKATPREDPTKVPPPPPDESIIGSDDMEAAVEAENRRLLAQRMAGRPAAPQPSGSALDAARMQMKGRRVPPHLDAQQVAEEVAGMDGAVGQVGQTPAFRMDEPDVLATQPTGTKPLINPQPQGRRNPRFQPPKT